MRSRVTLSATRAGLHRALPFAWLAAWLLVFGLLPPYEEVSATLGALEVSGNSITYDRSPVRGVATADVYDLYLEGTDPEAEYARMANNWRVNVVRVSVHPSTWSNHPELVTDLLQQHVQAAISAGLCVVVDYHVIGFPDGYYQPVPPEWG
jgi:hypothetical protein